MTTTTTHSVGTPAVTTIMIIIIIAVAIAGLLGVSYVQGRDVYMKADLAQRELVAQEDRAFCEGLGLDSKRFATCIDGLSEIRQRQRERSDAEAAGLL